MQLINDYTILILIGFLQLVLVGIAWLGRIGEHKPQTMKLWALANLLCGLGQLLRLARHDDWLFLTSTIPNSSVSLGLGLMAVALSQLFNMPDRRLLWLTLAAAVCQLLLRNFGLMEANRLAVVSLIFAGQFALLLFVAIRISRRTNVRLLPGLQLVNLIAVIACLIRMQESAGAGPSYQFLSAGPGQHVALLVMYMAIITNSMVFLLMADQTARSDAAD